MTTLSKSSPVEGDEAAEGTAEDAVEHTAEDAAHGTAEDAAAAPRLGVALPTLHANAAPGE